MDPAAAATYADDNPVIESVKAKLLDRDYAGVRALIDAAGTDTIPLAAEILNVCDILSLAEITIPGTSGPNPYWVLQLFPSADLSLIHAQHRKLLSLLHPLKPLFPDAADLALAAVHDAFALISDPDKRALFDAHSNGGAAVDSSGPVNSSNAGGLDATPTSKRAASLEAHVESGDEEQKKKRICAQEVSSEEAVAITVEMPEEVNNNNNCSDEGSFTQLSNPAMSITDTGGSGSVPPPRSLIRKPKWAPKDFSAEQVWAVYDGPDAMPRLYVKINSVVSQTELCVSFLEPHPMIDEEIQWVEENLPVVCGIFRAGRGTATMEMSRFSHLVDCDRSSKKSFYRIFPQKGEIWAMYRNWNYKWKGSDLVRYQCRVVEILSDFSEENGTNIRSLTAVNGRMTFFHRQLHEGFQLTRQLSRLEMLSFSHRIPAFTVLGIKDREIPKGSWHLEPDALPPKFIN